MTLTPGTTLGPYQIEAPLGAGGMGEVYRAIDTRIPRAVAIKVLPTMVTDDPARRARFEREARAIGSLNHPNICTLHDVGRLRPEGASAGQGDEVDFLVMELVEGETLAARLARGALPIDDACRYAIEIAGALDRAHRAGIVHRDLKPANVMITKSGVKLLDFGLAKFKAGPIDHQSALPTRPADGTAEGAILGTLQYMSPEQLEGRDADARSDIFAFGAVVYEMVTGRKAFEGKSAASLIGAILRDHPAAMATMQPHAPAALDRMMRTCLEKDPDDRWQSAGDLGRELQWARTQPNSRASDLDPSSTSRTSELLRDHRRERALWATAMLAVVAIASAVIWWQFRSAAPAATLGTAYADLNLPDTDKLDGSGQVPLAFSPDGLQLAYVATHGDTQQLFIRALSDPAPRLLARTEGAAMPFFSPDGQWIGFVANGKVKKAALSGAGVQELCECGAAGASWGSDGFIYLGATATGIQRLPQSGGAPVAFTTPDADRGETSHRWPQVLADDDVLLFTIVRGPYDDRSEVVRQSLSSGERTVLVRGQTGRFLNAGYLVYGHTGDLLAVPWRPSERSIGTAVPVSLREHPFRGPEIVSGFAVSDRGALAFLEGGADWLAHRLVWVSRDGTTEPLPQPNADYQAVAISPSGQQAVVQVGNAGLFMYDFTRDTFTSFVSGEGSQLPVWTPDGTRVFYRATRNGLRNVYWRRADGTGDEEPLDRKAGVIQSPGSITRDGRWLVFSESETVGSGSTRLYARDLTTDQVLLVVERGTIGRVHPDGHWLAYQTLAALGRPEIYLQPFPERGPAIPVSADGGQDPRWSRDGHELFYLRGDSMMAVEVKTEPFSIGKPHELYKGRFRMSGGGGRLYDVGPDGRFLRSQPIYPDPPTDHIRLVLNWADEVRKALGK